MMKKRSPSGRSPQGSYQDSLAERLKKRILKRYFVRLHMGLILAATTATGMLASKLLLEFGVRSILFRYPLAVLAAYALFLGMTRLWIRYTVVNRPVRWSIGEDVADVAFDVIDDSDLGHQDSARRIVFGGGDSGGGGASDAWDAGQVRSATTGSSPTGSSGSGFNLDIDLDEGIWILLALVAVILAIFGSGAYLIWAAPEILPEIAAGALLASSLKRSAQKAESRGWLRSVLSCTVIPFAIVFSLVCVLAYAIHHTCPNADTLLDALNCREGAAG